MVKIKRGVSISIDNGKLVIVVLERVSKLGWNVLVISSANLQYPIGTDLFLYDEDLQKGTVLFS